MFIEVTNKNNNYSKELINLHYLIAVKNNGKNGCSLIMRDRNTFVVVDESYEQICKLINHSS